MDTIFALSSGQPPAAIALLRVSGPVASLALERLAGKLPAPRRAQVAILRDSENCVLDEALVLWFPGPGTATGEDVAEFHLHGGRAVVRAVEATLAAMPGMRAAQPGEFTRRAFANGRIDLAQAEGLADLLSAETELQRRSAQAMAGGEFSRIVEDWRVRILTLAARVEAVLDFSDEDDVATLPDDFAQEIGTLGGELRAWLDRPRAELLKDGFRVVLAGPPNAGKSTLFNCLVESEAAIVSAVSGTTRDVIVRPVALDGIPFSFVDTAGLHSGPTDLVEAIGIDRATAELADGDVVLWLGREGQGPACAWEIEAQIDRKRDAVKAVPRHRVSALTGEGVETLRRDLIRAARAAMPRPGEAALNTKQCALLGDAWDAVSSADQLCDPLLVAESLRVARVAFERLVGRSSTEDMLDSLFGKFCIGK
jgi:tRNA modification GTPase